MATATVNLEKTVQTVYKIVDDVMTSSTVEMVPVILTLSPARNVQPIVGNVRTLRTHVAMDSVIVMLERGVMGARRIAGPVIYHVGTVYVLPKTVRIVGHVPMIVVTVNHHLRHLLRQYVEMESAIRMKHVTHVLTTVNRV